MDDKCPYNKKRDHAHNIRCTHLNGKLVQVKCLDCGQKRVWNNFKDHREMSSFIRTNMRIFHRRELHIQTMMTNGTPIRVVYRYNEKNKVKIAKFRYYFGV